MWSREQDQITASRRRRRQHHHNNHHKQQQQRGGISSSSSKSHSSISSPFSSSTLQPTSRRGRTMEGVWKDIALATPTTDLLHHNQNNHQCHYTHHHTTHITTTHQTSMSGVILQDFLAGPFKETTTSLSAPPQGQDPGHDMAPLGSASLRLPPPATILSLNSGLDFHYLDTPAPDTTTNSQPHHQVTNDNHHHPLPFTSTTPFADAIGSPAPGLFFYSKKRSPEQKQLDGSGEGGDRRHKRMIKNRESAARSRARKQAYSNELEMEVSQLEEENARLKRQHEELRLAMAAQLPTKKTLLRTSTF